MGSLMDEMKADAGGKPEASKPKAAKAGSTTPSEAPPHASDFVKMLYAKTSEGPRSINDWNEGNVQSRHEVPKDFPKAIPWDGQDIEVLYLNMTQDGYNTHIFRDHLVPVTKGQFASLGIHPGRFNPDGLYQLTDTIVYWMPKAVRDAYEKVKQAELDKRNRMLDPAAHEGARKHAAEHGGTVSPALTANEIKPLI
jgi:hypothetical protein